MSGFDRRHGSPHHDQNAADKKTMSGNGSRFDRESGIPNPTTAASASHSAAAANPDSTISAAVENPDAPFSNRTTAAASTSPSPAPAKPDATISAAVGNLDAPVSNPTNTASTSQFAAPANPDAPVSAAPAAFSRQHSPPPSPPPLTSHLQGPSTPTVFGVNVAAAPWQAMWSNEKPSAFETVDATVAPRKKLAWGSGVSNPTTAASTSHSAAAANPDSTISAAVENPAAPFSNPTTATSLTSPSPAPANPDATISAAVGNPDAPVSNPTTIASTSQSAAPANPDSPVSAAPVAFTRQHSPPPSPPPITPHLQSPSNPTIFGVNVAAAPWQAIWSNEKPSASETVDATVVQRKKLAWGTGVNPTTAASTSQSAAAGNPDAPVSAGPAAFSQQHCSPPPPLTYHQQRLSNPTPSGGVPGVAPWSSWAMWSTEKTSAFQRVGATVAPTKKLAWGVGANSTEKSPYFHIRVDLDDGISDDECGSSMAPGPVCKRKRNQITCPLSKQPMKKPKHEEPPKYTLSLDKLMEFTATWREPCL